MRIDQLFVSPEHEAEGVGRQLLEWAEGYAISERAASSRSSSRRENRRALDFYRGRGFTRGRRGSPRAAASTGVLLVTICELMQQVLVLNASYEPLNVCSVRRAHVLVFKGKAEVLEDLPRPLRSASDTFQWPHVIRLVQLRARPARGEAEDLAPGPLRARRLALPVLRLVGQAHARPRRPAGAGEATRSGRTSSPRARRAT